MSRSATGSLNPFDVADNVKPISWHFSTIDRHSRSSGSGSSSLTCYSFNGDRIQTGGAALETKNITVIGALLRR